MGEARLIPLPENLFIVGTVNVDETTYMFSPKVLDRANTFEFRVLSDELFLPPSSPKPIVPATQQVRSTLLAAATAHRVSSTGTAARGETLSGLMRSLHETLFHHGFEFGYRTFIESIRFAGLLEECGTAGAMRALDLIVMQKILPRIHGSRREVEPLLARILQFCENPRSAADDATSQAAPEIDPDAGLPVSADKVRRMLRLLKANQYVSFTG